MNNKLIVGNDQERLTALYRQLAEQNGFRSIWDMYEVRNFNEIPYTGVTTVVHNSYWPNGDLHVKDVPEIAVPIEGSGTWMDIWRAAEKAIQQSGDASHIYIEILRRDGDRLVIWCGS